MSGADYYVAKFAMFLDRSRSFHETQHGQGVTTLDGKIIVHDSRVDGIAYYAGGKRPMAEMIGSRFLALIPVESLAER
jgi:hypothetical protein